MAKETEINVYEIATTVVNSIPGMASSIAVIGAFNSEITDITNVSGARIAHSLFGTSTTFGTFKGTDTYFSRSTLTIEDIKIVVDGEEYTHSQAVAAGIIKSGFTTTKAKYINAPIINELPLCLECRLIKIVEEDLYIAEIINVNAEESILDEKGNISLEKFIPIAYDPSTHGYYKVQGRVGNAFSDGKKLIK